jgi:PAS domain S-box-containing protein
VVEAGTGTFEDRGSDARPAAPTDLALAEAVRQSRDAITVTTAALDAPGPEIVFVNPAFTRMTGYEAAEVLGRSPRLMQGPRTERAVLDRLVADLRAGGTFAGETVNYRKGGEPFRIEWQITPVRDGAGRTTHYVAVQRDVTERRHAANAEAALRRLAELVARGAPPEAVFARVAEDAARLLGGDGGGVARIDLSGTRTIVGTWAAPGAGGPAARCRRDGDRG